MVNFHMAACNATVRFTNQFFTLFY